jgi:hypothetical protein
LIAIGIFICLVFRRRREDEASGEAGYETDTETLEEMIDTDISDFGATAEVEIFTDQLAIDGGFGVSDTFAQNPEEA